MTAYFIAEVEITDQRLYDEYKPIAEASIKKHGGKYLVRGGAAEALEGDAPKRIVVLEFPSTAAAREWYQSEDYAPGLKLRKKAARSRVMIVEGAPPG